MLTLQANESIAGDCDVGSQVTITINGMTLTGTTETYGNIKQAQLSATTGNVVYTTPSSTTAFVKTIFICNTDLLHPYNINIYISVGASNANNSNLVYSGRIPAGGNIVYNEMGWITYNQYGNQIVSGGQGFPGIVIGGNTSGTTASVTSGTIQLVAGNNIQFSQQANTLTIQMSDSPISYWDNMGTNATSAYIVSYNSLHIFPLKMNNVFPDNMTVQSFMMDMSGSISSTNATHTLSTQSVIMRLGIYTQNGNQLSLANSASYPLWVKTDQTYSVTSEMSQAVHGPRWAVLTAGHWSQGSCALSQVHYWIAYDFAVSSAGASQNGATYLSISLLGQSAMSPLARSGTMGAVSVANNTTKGYYPFMGILSVSTNAIPNAIAMSDINKQSATVNFIPHILMNNYHPNI